MSDDTTGSGDSPERAREKRDSRREAEERETERGQGDRAGREDVGEESVLEGVPGSTANKPTG